MYLLVLVLVAGLSACIRGSVSGELPPPAAEKPPEDLGPGDVLEVRVAEQQELTGKYQVGEDGSIRVPWIGVVKVAGRSPREIEGEIAGRLADGWLRDPQVTVLAERLQLRQKERENREISVLGQVKEPGSYPFKERLTLVKAITLAGGLSPLAQKRRVKLIRDTDAGRKTFEIDVNAILDSRVEDIALQPGDIVFVPESPI